MFDSGVGGLSVLRAFQNLHPEWPIIYLADQAHVPYGARSMYAVKNFSEIITHFLISQGCHIIVIACNTASAAALYHLRQMFPATQFVGMEPAVKPAVEFSRSKVIGVLATPATFQGRLFASVVERFANGVTILKDTCPGLVQQIEEGELDTPHTRQILAAAIHPMLEKNVDTIVLGCTHYPFVIPLIQDIAGQQVRIIDPSPAVAHQIQRLLPPTDSRDYRLKYIKTRLISTGNPEHLAKLLPLLLEMEFNVEPLIWHGAVLQNEE